MLQQIFSLSFMTAFLAAAVRLAVPLMYGGIGETIAEKSGILNIGMEGVMLSGAFFFLCRCLVFRQSVCGTFVRYGRRTYSQSASRTSIHYADPEPVCIRSCHQHAYAWRHQLFV